MKAVPPTLALCACLLLCSTACEDEQPVRVYRAPKEFVATQPATTQAAQAPAIAWTVPDGWKRIETGGVQYRYATFAVDPSDPSLQLVIAQLEPQKLTPNIVRWRQQLGLPPADEPAMLRDVQHLDVDGAHADAVDLLGPARDGAPRQRMLAALIHRQTHCWSFKLVGPDDKAAAQKDRFLSFIRSVRFTGNP